MKTNFLYGVGGFALGVMIMAKSTGLLLAKEYPEVLADMDQRYGWRKKK